MRTQAAGGPMPGARALGSGHFDLEKDWDPFGSPKRSTIICGSTRRDPFMRRWVMISSAVFGQVPALRYRISTAAPLRSTRKSVACAVPQCGGDAQGRADRARPARFHHLPRRRMPGEITDKNADRLDVSREGEVVVLRVSALSFLHHQVRSLTGSLKLVGKQWRWKGSGRPSRRATAPAAAPWLRRRDSISSGWIIRPVPG